MTRAARAAYGPRKGLNAEVTALHMAAWSGGAEVAGLLLAAGADPGIRDTRHDSDARGWAEHFGRIELRDVLRAHAPDARTPRPIPH